MDILLTNYRLGRIGGTQTVIRDLALGLLGRGHRVAAFSSARATPGDSLADLGVPVIDAPEAAPFTPDVIHGQHHIDAMIAIAAFPGVPAVYHCHGAVLVETPPLHPRILRYLTITPTLRLRMAVESGIDPEAIEVVPNAVDLERFGEVRRPPPHPARALAYGRGLSAETRLGRALTGAARRAGLALEFAGIAAGRPILDPHRLLPGYDVVFASGLSALEALVSGCAVVPANPEACGEMIGTANFDRLRESNFSMPVNSPPVDEASVLAALSRYDAADAAAATRRARDVAGFEAFIDRALAVYERVIAAGARSPADPLAESRAASRYLRSIASCVRVLDAASDPSRPPELAELAAPILRRLAAIAAPAAATVADHREGAQAGSVKAARKRPSASTSSPEAKASSPTVPR